MKAIDEVWNNSCQSKDYSHDEDYMTYSQFEKAVKELLKLQREVCKKAFAKAFVNYFINQLSEEEMYVIIHFQDTILSAEVE